MSEQVGSPRRFAKYIDLGITNIVEKTIDQAVQNGGFDYDVRRVTREELVRIAFQKMEIDTDIFQRFNASLGTEHRFVDETDEGLSYEPVVSNDCKIRPSQRSIVAGKGRCTPKERIQTYKSMDYLACKLFDSAYRSRDDCDGLPGVMETGEISRALRAAGIRPLSYDEFGALKKFMDIDPRFHVIGDGRIALIGIYTGAIDALVETEFIDDVDKAVRCALADVYIDRRDCFTRGAFLGTLKSQNGHIHKNQVAAILDALNPTLGIELLGKGIYRVITGDQKL